MDLSLFDHFESANGPSSSAGGSKRAASDAAPVSKKAKFNESGIEERLAGTVIEKVRQGLLMFTTFAYLLCGESSRSFLPSQKITPPRKVCKLHTTIFITWVFVD
jgi:hypothetical protein